MPSMYSGRVDTYATTKPHKNTAKPNSMGTIRENVSEPKNKG